ncbi:terminase [Ectopseudomonas toyotomiensis]|uniref:Uncharacterized protein n=1 Tax=Ectopseudomonas toyotomiensis TaxID=554344 RepID=A0A1I5PD06_9GAMM|nr:DUF3486 family protein [Pseudomonas toyotomiensis]PIA73654.1 terminase [Pseudomonas toyotomiensis]SFP32014.1 Protein of unknown function [Pseudomonas toyotomiensis]
MPPRSKVAQLPPRVKAWLDQALVENNFSGYELLSAELAGRGYSIGKSALHSYGQSFEERLAALKMASEQAKAVVAVAPDDDGAVNEALLRLTQERLFTLLADGKGPLDISKVGKTVAEIIKASVTQKKYAAEAEARRAALQEAANVAEGAMTSQGMSKEAIDAIKRDILGIA